MKKVPESVRRELAALSARSEKDIDFSDLPATTREDWASAVRGKFYRPVKKQLTVRIDADVVEWLKSRGSGYQSRLNAILRGAMLFRGSPPSLIRHPHLHSPPSPLILIHSRMKIALAQFNPTVGDFDGNAARILALSLASQALGAELAVFSELCLWAIFPLISSNAPPSSTVISKRWLALRPQMPLPAIVGYAGRVDQEHHRAGKSIANKAALIPEGRVVFEQSKMLLPTYDVFDESRYFQPGDKHYVYGLGREQLGITVCEDAWNDKTFWSYPLYARDPVSESSPRN